MVWVEEGIDDSDDAKKMTVESLLPVRELVFVSTMVLPPHIPLFFTSLTNAPATPPASAPPRPSLCR